MSVLFFLQWNASNHPEGTEQLFVSVERQNVGGGGEQILCTQYVNVDIACVPLIQ